jgi:hypothetical protein
MALATGERHVKASKGHKESSDRSYCSLQRHQLIKVGLEMRESDRESKRDGGGIQREVG